jgi:hypothetical protein
MGKAAVMLITLTEEQRRNNHHNSCGMCLQNRTDGGRNSKQRGSENNHYDSFGM